MGCFVFKNTWGWGRGWGGVRYVIYPDFFINIYYMDDFLTLCSSERRNICLAPLESAVEWLKKLSIFVFSQNHKMRISKALDSKIYPDFKFWFLILSWGVWRIERAFFILAFTREPSLPWPLVLRIGALGMLLWTVSVGGHLPNGEHSLNREQQTREYEILFPDVYFFM